MNSTPHHPSHHQPQPSPQHPARPTGPGPGVFVPEHGIAAAVCLTLGVVAGVLAWLVPAVWVPVGAGIAVTCLALALYALWNGRHRAWPTAATPRQFQLAQGAGQAVEVGECRGGHVQGGRGGRAGHGDGGIAGSGGGRGVVKPLRPGLRRHRRLGSGL